MNNIEKLSEQNRFRYAGYDTPEKMAFHITKCIRRAVNACAESVKDLRRNIAKAYEIRVWETLGYDSWDAYVNTEFGATLKRLNKDDRQMVVGSLAASGMSTRAIAPVVGAHHATVARDIEAASVANATDDEPRKVTGLDGRVRKSPEKKADAEVAHEIQLDPELLASAKAALEGPPVPSLDSSAVSVDALIVSAISRVVRANHELDGAVGDLAGLEVSDELAVKFGPVLDKMKEKVKVLEDALRSGSWDDEFRKMTGD